MSDPTQLGHRADLAFAELVRTMHRLRAPGGCPWDAEQTHESLKPYLVEEAYEVLEAIDCADDRELCEELGDLLLQVVFHSELASERNAFTIEDVARGITEKLVRRHPHVFADLEVGSSAEVATNWSRIKAQEKRDKKEQREGREGAGGAGTQSPASVLEGVPRNMPALLRAHRLGEKAAGVGFDWNDCSGVRAKLGEELAEIDEAAVSGDTQAQLREIGDLIFAATSYARHLGANVEYVVHDALDRFQERFAAVEGELDRDGVDVHDAPTQVLEDAWKRAKRD